jgi:hypothetical protein
MHHHCWLQIVTPGNPDVIATANPSVPSERRRFEVVVNFTDAACVGACMLALNKRGFVYTNSVEPIEEGETVVSGMVSGIIKLAADEDEAEVVAEVFDQVLRLVEPFGGECPECRFVD